ncbi:MAG: carboxypeptidase Q [Myxococcota bacterium]|jgi:carboxypeptidase Q
MLVLLGLLITDGHARPQRTADPDIEAVAAQLLGRALTTNDAYEELVELCDDIGNRLTGSPELERAVEWATAKLAADGLDARAEPVTVPVWRRNAESATLLAPLERELNVLGLGWSVGTGSDGVTGEVVVVDDFDHLERLPRSEIEGKIVLWDVPFSTYGQTVQYRSRGASEAARKGAVASLVRSVTPQSLSTPHTGAQRYAEDAPRIPAMAITVEDALAMRRWQDRGKTVKVHLQMGAEELPDQQSANVVADLRGRERPEEYVLLGCHLDSWDVGQGAQDDGAGCVIAMDAARLIAELDVRPRRSIRVVLFTNEESGLAGGKAFAAAHSSDTYVAAIEADTGAGAPEGFRVDVRRGDDTDRLQARALERLGRWTPLLAPVGAGALESAWSGADIGPLVEITGTLGLGLKNDTSGYWPIHHTPADTIDKVDAATLRRNVGAVAVMAWMLAESSDTPLPVSDQ